MMLADYLTRTKTSVAEFAGRIGVTTTAVHRYVRLERVPRPRVMVRINEATEGQVGAADFYPQSERAA